MGSKIYKGQVVEIISSRTGWSNNQASKNLQIVLDTLAESLLEHDRITLTGFGTFDVRPTPARKMRVISGEHAGELRDVDPSHRLAFTPSPGLLEKVRGAR